MTHRDATHDEIHDETSTPSDLRALRRRVGPGLLVLLWGQLAAMAVMAQAAAPAHPWLPIAGAGVGGLAMLLWVGGRGGRTARIGVALALPLAGALLAVAGRDQSWGHELGALPFIAIAAVAALGDRWSVLAAGAASMAADLAFLAAPSISVRDLTLHLVLLGVFALAASRLAGHLRGLAATASIARHGARHGARTVRGWENLTLPAPIPASAPNVMVMLERGGPAGYRLGLAVNTVGFGGARVTARARVS